MAIDVGLASVKLVLVVLAKHAQRPHWRDAHAEPWLAECRRRHELLDQERLALPPSAGDPGHHALGYPARYYPTAVRDGQALQHCRVGDNQWCKRVAAARVPGR